MFEHLDRIEKLGFTITLNWNKSFDIFYMMSDNFSNINSNQWPTDIRVLFCSYDSYSEPSYEDIIETACDFFYMWYNKNVEFLTDYELEPNDRNFDKLLDSGLGDITQKVYRDFNIDSLLD